MPEPTSVYLVNTPAEGFALAVPVGVDRARFRKDILRVGTFTHPTAGWTLEVTPERLDRLVENFRRTREMGIKVPVTADHKPSVLTALGELVEVEREGDRLFGVHELVGEDALKAAQNPAVEVSVEIDPSLKSTEGTVIGEALVASSMVLHPVMEGQGRWERIAASRHANGAESGQGKLPVLRMPADKGHTPAHGVRKMSTLIEQLNAKHGFSLSADADDAAVLAAIEGKLGETTAKLETATQSLSRVKAENDELKAKGIAPKVDPELLDDRRSFIGEKLDGLVKAGKLLPTLKDKLHLALAGAADAPNAYTLSRQLSKTDKSVAVTVLDILEQNDPIKLGEQTRAQTVTMGRAIPDGDPESQAKVTQDFSRMTREAAGVHN